MLAMWARWPDGLPCMACAIVGAKEGKGARREGKEGEGREHGRPIGGASDAVREKRASMCGHGCTVKAEAGHDSGLLARTRGVEEGRRAGQCGAGRAGGKRKGATARAGPPSRPKPGRGGGKGQVGFGAGLEKKKFFRIKFLSYF